MIRFLIRLAVYVVAAAIGLIVAGLVLSGFSVSFSSFLEVVLVFAVVQSLLAQAFGRMTERNAPMLSAGVGLFSALVSLFVTSLISDGLTIDGASTWIVAAVIIWIVSMLATFLLPLLLVKAGVQAARERRNG